MSIFEGLDDIFVGALGEDEPFIIRCEGEPDIEVNGIFVRDYLGIETGGAINGEVEGKRSVASVPTKKLPYALVDAFLEYEGRRFLIVSNRPDERDMTTLVLEYRGAVE